MLLPAAQVTVISLYSFYFNSLYLATLMHQIQVTVTVTVMPMFLTIKGIEAAHSTFLLDADPKMGWTCPAF